MKLIFNLGFFNLSLSLISLSLKGIENIFSLPEKYFEIKKRMIKL
jgi:hypothetical protein